MVRDYGIMTMVRVKGEWGEVGDILLLLYLLQGNLLPHTTQKHSKDEEGTSFV